MFSQGRLSVLSAAEGGHSAVFSVYLPVQLGGACH